MTSDTGKIITRKRIIIASLGVVFVVFMVWRFTRFMNIYVVSDAFARPMHIENIPEPLESLSAKECGECHQETYKDWSTSIHSKAWTERYFQVDFKFDGNQQTCMNCHIPLEDQQENLVLGFRDKERFDPILEPNPNFDPVLQKEGVTCAVCHVDVKTSKIIGPRGGDGAPHPVSKMGDPNQTCLRCHVVSGERWDTFYSIPPCGTVAEIRDVGQDKIDCVGCHMPSVSRPIVDGGEVRKTGRHLFRGGHDKATVKKALKASFKSSDTGGKTKYVLEVTNVGAGHYFPTGTPDRHLIVKIRALDKEGKVVKEMNKKLIRKILWRPFIIDLWDTRLPRWEKREYSLALGKKSKAVKVEAIVEYHLLDEARRQRIGYENTEPIFYEIYRKELAGTEVSD